MSFRDLEVLGLDHFRKPEPGLAPEGWVEQRQVLLFPGGHGVFDIQGQPIAESFLRRGPGATDYVYGEPQVQPVPASGDVEGGGEILFIPYARFDVFGHLLTEAAGHLSLLLDPEVNLLGTRAARARVVLAADSHPSIEPVRALLGLDPERILSTRSLQRPLICSRVLIARPSMINRCAVDRRHFLAVRRLLDRLYNLDEVCEGPWAWGDRARDFDVAGKLYLSRSRLPPGCRRLAEEPLLEQELHRRGWSVIYPETLPLTQQLRLLAEAKIIAGCIGSAMHLLMYFGEALAGRPMIGLGPIDQRLNRNFVYQFQQQRLDYRQISCLERDPECPKRAHGVHVQDLRLSVAAPRLAEAIEALAVDMVVDREGSLGRSQPLPD